MNFPCVCCLVSSISTLAKRNNAELFDGSVLKKKVINNGINKKGIKKRGATLWYKVAPRNDIK